MSITVEGHLKRDAAAAVSGAQRAAILLFTVDVGPGLPVEVRHLVGTEPDSLTNAMRLAKGMRRGARIVATADQVAYRADHGEATLVMRTPSAIRVGDWELR